MIEKKFPTGKMINATGHFTTKIIRNYRLWYNVSVPYPNPGLAENNDIVELRAALKKESAGWKS